MHHDLYETGDKDAPAAILDSNGEVVLALCKRCGQGEATLAPSCPGDPDAIPAVLAKAQRVSQGNSVRIEAILLATIIVQLEELLHRSQRA